MEDLRRHNLEVRTTAEFRASEMALYPSPLEAKMISFLDKHHVNYETQKIFYIYAENGWIIRYYIADFFVPSVNVIIEVDGKFHDKQKQHDKDRTKIIQQNYPWVQVLRYRWEDFSDNAKMAELLSYVK